MNSISVPFIQTNDPIKLAATALLLDEIDRHSLAYTPWSSFSYKPSVTFALAHDTRNLLLKFYVREKYIRASHTQYNAAVYEDSCVELFIAFNDEPGYFNLEMNCAGAVLLAFGNGRDDRQFVSEAALKNIKRQVLIVHDAPVDEVYWELSAIIPLNIFNEKLTGQISKTAARGNVYKCGDLLPEPHFVSWCEIQSPEPNFHRPEFFGNFEFE